MKEPRRGPRRAAASRRAAGCGAQTVHRWARKGHAAGSGAPGLLGSATQRWDVAPQPPLPAAAPLTTATPTMTSRMLPTTSWEKVRPRKEDSTKHTKGMMSSLAICGGGVGWGGVGWQGWWLAGGHGRLGRRRWARAGAAGVRGEGCRGGGRAQRRRGTGARALLHAYRPPPPPSPCQLPLGTRPGPCAAAARPLQHPLGRS